MSKGIDFDFDLSALPAYQQQKMALYDRLCKQALPVLTSFLMREMDMQGYVPMDTGILARSAQQASNLEDGEIIYDTPYAYRVYTGEKINFSKEKHPRATHHWDKAFMADHEAEVVEMAQKLMEGRI